MANRESPSPPPTPKPGTISRLKEGVRRLVSRPGPLFTKRGVGRVRPTKVEAARASTSRGGTGNRAKPKITSVVTLGDYLPRVTLKRHSGGGRKRLPAASSSSAGSDEDTSLKHRLKRRQQEGGVGCPNGTPTTVAPPSPASRPLSPSAVDTPVLVDTGSEDDLPATPVKRGPGRPRTTGLGVGIRERKAREREEKKKKERDMSRLAEEVSAIISRGILEGARLSNAERDFAAETPEVFRTLGSAEIAAGVGEALGAISMVAARSKTIKGSFQAALKRAVGDVHLAVGTLICRLEAAEGSPSAMGEELGAMRQEMARLRAENNSLRADLDGLRRAPPQEWPQLP